MKEMYVKRCAKMWILRRIYSCCPNIDANTTANENELITPTTATNFVSFSFFDGTQNERSFSAEW